MTTATECAVDAATPKEAAEALDLAADILAAEPWIQGGWGTFCGPKCADGALVAAVGIEKFTAGTSLDQGKHTLPSSLRQLYRKASNALDAESQHRYGVGYISLNDSIGGWRRYPDNIETSRIPTKRDKRVIIRLMRRAAKRLRKQS